MGGLVVDEVGMDELVREVEVACRVDLVERAAGQALVVVRGDAPKSTTVSA
jgi:hypothetical protein